MILGRGNFVTTKIQSHLLKGDQQSESDELLVCCDTGLNKKDS